MLAIAAYIIIFCIYFSLPLPFRLLICLINFAVPDSIPYLDEIIMIGGVISKISFVDHMLEFKDEHPILARTSSIAIFLLFVFVVIALIDYVF